MNLLIAGSWIDAKDYIRELEALGHNVRYTVQESGPIPCAPDWVEGTICNAMFQLHDIKEFTNLRYIQVTSVGLDRIPVDYVNEQGIALRNARGVYSLPMAEHALGSVLALYRQMPTLLAQQQAHVWEKRDGMREVSGKGVCIIGCGNAGTECAKRFAAMGADVVGINRSQKSHQGTPYNAIYGMDKLDHILQYSDIVILALPDAAETHHMFNAERFDKMREGAILINIARGGLIDTDAMVAALQSGKLGGAVLDVFTEEPLPADNPLWDMPNVILTPHNSFIGEGNEARMDQVIMANLAEFVAQE